MFVFHNLAWRASISVSTDPRQGRRQGRFSLKHELIAKVSLRSSGAIHGCGAATLGLAVAFSSSRTHRSDEMTRAMLINDLNLMDYKIHLNVNHSGEWTWIPNSALPWHGWWWRDDTSVLSLKPHPSVRPSLSSPLLGFSALTTQYGMGNGRVIWMDMGVEIYGHLIECRFNGTGHQFNELHTHREAYRQTSERSPIKGPHHHGDLFKKHQIVIRFGFSGRC